jgi:inhibitor of cysteine peptidase
LKKNLAMKSSILLAALFVGFLSPALAADPTIITAEPGKTFTLTLDSNPTTGYRWELANPVDEKHVKLISSEYHRGSTQLMGAGGKEIWTFKAAAEGNTKIHLKYVRPWETNMPPAQTTNFLVAVKKSGG